jgi:hypothetical protein
MTYWPNLHVHTQPYFAPLQTYQFLSFAATSLPAELMGDQCHQGAIRLYLHVSTKEKERKKTHKLLDSNILQLTASSSSTSLQCYNIIQLYIQVCTYETTNNTHGCTEPYKR